MDQEGGVRGGDVDVEERQGEGGTGGCRGADGGDRVGVGGGGGRCG